ncbi:hypothetical protein EMCRGX_G034013 [Ephydatia muelleri]
MLAALIISAVFVVGGAPHDLPSVVLEGEPGSQSTGDVKWLSTHKNQYCKVEKGKEERCGVKDLNPAEGDGLLMWKPERCSGTGCKCVPVREVQVRHDNDGTVLAKAPKRYRIFECA